MPVTETFDHDQEVRITGKAADMQEAGTGGVDMEVVMSDVESGCSSDLNETLMAHNNDNSMNNSTNAIPNNNNDTNNNNATTIASKQRRNTITEFLFKNPVRPRTTAFLKPGAKFVGSQQSARTTYHVEVELKYVDLNQSYLNGYLKIIGLTESYPELITFFESDIVNEKNSFYTNRDEWGTNDKIDIQHWSRFNSWNSQLPIKKIIDKSYKHENHLKFDNLYMRWKEKFLVPDYNVSNIEGASFAGFYYINFNQRNGNIMGLYFHKSSEKFQQLELNFVNDYGCSSTFAFH